MKLLLSSFILGTFLLVACSSNNVALNRSSMHGDSRGFLPGMNVDLASLPEAKPSEIIDVEDGATIELNPMLIRNKISGEEFAMYGYNGQFPGPTLKVKQGSTFTVNVKNMIDQPTTIHWHGIRLENEFDGAEGVTQEAIEPGGSFTYQVTVPDEGIFWYHPHVREDMQQDMGLYGLIHVTSQDPDAYSAVDQEEYVVLDDLLLDRNRKPIPYGSIDADYALMGRFGNFILVNGAASQPVEVGLGTVVRFAFLNASNTRTYRIVKPAGGTLKIVGEDTGRNKKEYLTDSYTLAPSERVIAEMFFWDDDVNVGAPGMLTVPIVTSGPPSDPTTTFSTTIVGGVVGSDRSKAFHELQMHEDIAADIDHFRPFFDQPVDKTLHLSVETGMGHMGHGMMMDHASPDGIEWEDTMAMMNQMSNKSNTQWKLIDEETDNENMDIHWKFTKGDVVKIRVINDSQEQGSDHAMQHPIHLHGQRFLVLSDDGEKNDNLAWKDTVLVPAGHTVDLLVEMSNPGDWMIHCHIAEHLTNGMMGMFTVE